MLGLEVHMFVHLCVRVNLCMCDYLFQLVSKSKEAIDVISALPAFPV